MKGIWCNSRYALAVVDRVFFRCHALTLIPDRHTKPDYLCYSYICSLHLLMLQRLLVHTYTALTVTDEHRW
jgi:hypothetical protein